MSKMLPIQGTSYKSAGFALHTITGLDLESCKLLALIVEAEMKDFQPLFYGSFANVIDQAVRIKSRDVWKSGVNDGIIPFTSRVKYKAAISRLIEHWLSNGYSW